MNSAGRIEEHYSSLYRGEKVGLIERPMRGWPRDRFHAAVFWCPSGNRVLDVGCGDGTVLYSLRDRFQELHGTELSSERARRASELLASLGGAVIQNNIEDGAPYPDQYFDVLICSDVIEHLIDVRKALREMERLLSPSGSLLLITPNFARLGNRLRLVLGRFPSTSRPNQGLAASPPGELLDGGHFHYFTFSMLANLLRAAGFGNVSIHGIGRFGRLHEFWPSLLSRACVLVGRK